MTFEQLKDAVRSRVNDMSESLDESVPDFINEAIGIIAYDLGGLPSLKKFATVVTLTTANHVSMPTDSSGILRYVGDEDGEITVLPNLETLVRRYPKLDETGSVVDYVVLEGSDLYYQPIISPANTLYLIYFANPTVLVSGSDIPTYLPSVLHRSSIVPKAAELIFSIIEEGVEGDHVNTLAAQSDYAVGLAQLRAWKKRITRRESPTIWE